MDGFQLAFPKRGQKQTSGYLRRLESRGWRVVSSGNASGYADMSGHQLS
jgi:hypothetical protein